MKKNMGRLDQFLRLGISLILIYAGFIDQEMISDPLTSWIVGGIGIASLFFALTRFCPLYALAGINTCSHEKDK